MSVTKEKLHTLIDMVDTNEYAVLFQLLMKFVPTDLPAEDEIAALEAAKKQLVAKEFYRDNEIDWDNLERMDLN